jgi:hypothetical protein
MAPADVLRFTSYSASPRNLTINGLTPSKKYNIELYASRAVNPGISTEFSISQISDTIPTYDNFNNKAVFTNLTADAQGRIIVNINNLNSYNYLNGFTIIEYDAASSRSGAALAVNEQTAAIPEKIFPGTKRFEIYPNPVNDRFVLKFKNNSTDEMRVQIIDQHGEIKREFRFAKIQIPYSSLYLSANGLASGAYIVRVMTKNGTQSATMLKF